MMLPINYGSLIIYIYKYENIENSSSYLTENYFHY